MVNSIDKVFYNRIDWLWILHIPKKTLYGHYYGVDIIDLNTIVSVLKKKKNWGMVLRHGCSHSWGSMYGCGCPWTKGLGYSLKEMGWNLKPRFGFLLFLVFPFNNFKQKIKTLKISLWVFCFFGWRTGISRFIWIWVPPSLIICSVLYVFTTLHDVISCMLWRANEEWH